jgi:hypothetical protein
MATGDDGAAAVIERLIIVCRLDPVTRTYRGGRSRREPGWVRGGALLRALGRCRAPVGGRSGQEVATSSYLV